MDLNRLRVSSWTSPGKCRCVNLRDRGGRHFERFSFCKVRVAGDADVFWTPVLWRDGTPSRAGESRPEFEGALGPGLGRLPAPRGLRTRSMKAFRVTGPNHDSRSDIATAFAGSFSRERRIDCWKVRAGDPAQSFSACSFATAAAMCLRIAFTTGWAEVGTSTFESTRISFPEVAWP